MRIAIIAYKFQIMGRATDQGFLWPIAKGLQERGHQVTVISSSSPMKKPSISRDGVEVHYLFDESHRPKAKLRFDKLALEKFVALHAEKPFDLVHCMDRHGLPISRLKKRLRFTVAFDVNSTRLGELFSIVSRSQETLKNLVSTFLNLSYLFLKNYFFYDRDVLSQADGLFYTYSLQREVLERYYLFPEQKMYQVPYGMEIGDLRINSQKTQLLAHYKLPENSQIVFADSDMIEPIECKNLITAFERVAIQKPNAYLLISGRGLGYKEIEFHLLSLALSKKVILTGILDSDALFELISGCDAFVSLSSRSSGFEATMLEAMAQKKVIIGSELSPMSQLIEDGEDGFLIRPADTSSLSQLLIELFSGNLPAEQIGSNARNKIIQLFDTRQMLDSIEKSYLEITDRARRDKRRNWTLGKEAVQQNTK